MTWAWRQPVAGNAKVVLLALADRARPEDGTCWPGLKHVAAMCSLEERTVRRQVAALEEAGLLERVERVRSDGSRTSNLIVLKLPSPPVGADRGVGSVASGRTEPKGEPKEETSPTKQGSPEHHEFSEWIGHHHELTGDAVLRAGTKGRAHVAAMFGARREEGLSLEDLKLATAGAWGDEWRRKNGHYGHESILRPNKVQGLVAKGRRAVREAGEQRTDWTAFDGD